MLIQRDTGRKARIPAKDLLPLLTEGRRTSRGQSRGGRGNWGVYVRSVLIDEIEIEGGSDSPARVGLVWA